MKICPRCQKTYTDDNLNFCLEDGSVLTSATADSMPATVLMNQPRQTQPGASPSGQVAAPPAWNTPPQQQYSTPPAKKSSKTWIWVVLILGFLMLVCGGAFAGLLLIGYNADSVAKNTVSISKSSSTPAPSPGKSRSPSPTASPDSTTTPFSTSTSDRNKVENIDLSSWIEAENINVLIEMDGSDFVMGTKRKGFYYVVAAPADTYTSESANTSVTLRNIDNADSRLGYGVVFHSNPRPLQQGYAFLIDSKKKKFRVVHHSPQKEENVVAWTSSDSINSGSAENTLEVRDLPDAIELYINGEMVTSIKNDYGYSGGVVGLYSGDAAKIAFSDFKIKR